MSRAKWDRYVIHSVITAAVAHAPHALASPADEDTPGLAMVLHAGRSV
jgi:hypothetical protein